MSQAWSGSRKGLKRKLREVDRDVRKKFKAEDTAKSKQRREEERLERLESTVKEKLTREAAKERAKVVKHAVRTVSAAALTLRSVAVHLCKDPSVEVKTAKADRGADEGRRPMAAEMRRGLPPTFEGAYLRDVLRVWEFATAFSKVRMTTNC